MKDTYKKASKNKLAKIVTLLEALIVNIDAVRALYLRLLNHYKYLLEKGGN